MKIKHINKRFIPALAIVMGLSSCLKDKNPQLDFSKLKPVVEISVPITTDTGVPSPDNSGDGASNTFSFGLVASSAPVAYQIPVNYAYSKPSPGISVTLAVDKALLDKYNDIEGDDVQILPTANYTITNLKVNIASGTQVAYLPVSFLNGNTLNPDVTYGLPVKITDASGTAISGNYGTVIVIIKIKNQYDGKFTLSGHINRFTSPTTVDPALSGNFSGLTSTLTTRDITSVWFNAQVWADGTKSAGLGTPGVDGVVFAVNGTTNKVTVTCPANATLGNTAGYDSRWEPATKTFYVGFEWGASASAKRVAIDTLKMK